MTDPTGDAVAIVGIGCLFPGASSADAFWRNIRDGVDATSTVPADRWDPVFYDPDANSADRFYCRRGGFVDDLASFDPTAFGIMPVAVEGAEPDQLLALAAASAALDDAGRPHERLDPTRIGVVLGRGGYMGAGVARLDQRVHGAQQLVESLRTLLPDLDDATLQAVKADFQSRLGPERPEASIGLVPNLAASRIANRLDLQGPAYTVDAACASSLIAVERGIGELASGRCDLMLVGGVHHCHDVTLWSVFTQLHALSPSERIRPFGRDADGILVGEGTGIFALKRLADADRDGDRVYAVIRGTGVASDGRDSSLMSPRPEGQVLAVASAWKASGLDPDRVGLIEAHGTATPVGDATELETLHRVFGGPMAGSGRVGLGSVKSMIGHAMPAAGAAGLAKAALAVFHGELPPTLHAKDEHPALAATRFRLIHETEPWEGDALRTAGINAFGFGGINAHLVIEEHPANRERHRTRRRSSAASTPATTPTTTTTIPTAIARAAEELLLFAGADSADVAAELAAWAPGTATAIPPSTSGPARLAIVDPDPKRLQLAAKVVERGTAFRGRNDVWFEPEGLLTSGGKIAFLFPGVEPAFEPWAEDVAAHFGLPWAPPAAGTSPLEAQSLGILHLGMLLAEALARLGVQPDVVAGHSLGEWTGQIVSGMIPTDFVDEFVAGMRPGSIEVSDVVFAALGAGASVAHELVYGLADAYVSHDNCVHQSVICAHPEAMEIALEHAKAKKVFAQELPFRSGFHSPLFEPFVANLVGQFESLPLQAPTVPMWSATTCAPYPNDRDGIAELAVRHLVAPVRFRELVDNLHHDGVRVFVQVGTGSLGGFVDDTLRDREMIVIPMNVAKQTGLGQLWRAAAALWVEGADIAFDVLDPAGTSRLDPAAERPATRQVPGTTTPGTVDGSNARVLPLGSGLVRGLSPLLIRSGGGSGSGAIPIVDRNVSGPVLAEFREALQDAADAADAVLRAAEAGPQRGPNSTPGPTSATTTRELSLAAEPAWADHAFFEQPDGWPVSEDRFPLVPMTGILEMLAEAACDLVPGHVAVALEDIRAFQWLAVDPPTTIAIRATIDPDVVGPGVVVRTSIDRHARATVRLAPAYPSAPAPASRPLHGEVILPCTPANLYSDGHLFHGPEYQGVLTFDESGTDGIRGRLVSRPAPGALLDNAGQLFGFWVANAVDRDKLVLPTSIDRISFYGPHPAPGVELACVVNVTDLGDVAVRADLELTIDDTVWCRIEGWEDRRFQTDDALFDLLRAPHRLALAQPQPGGWVMVEEAWPDSASRDVVRRRFLGRDERAEYDGRNPNAQRQWLLGRIAAKDAARHHLWAHGAGDLFPIEVSVTNDDNGQPHLRVGDLRVSIAHTGGIGVALVANGVDVGIDIEAVEPRSATFEATTLTEAEQALLGPLDGPDRDLILTRAWCAKEAAAKAAGTGLQGRPRDWVITGTLLGPTGDHLVIGTHTIATTILRSPASDPDAKEYVVAWTVTDH